ncbi:FecR family protein [Pseudomonas sp. BBP2017]|uniref:FecR family protein n=1 Tax=Pseudomonas sp. BBP2017 TaxID=2109731 RepID=UPI000D13E75D|nr:FecR domain-containing protein [Pseudomonas sp. BBP2017]PSS56531.1 sugar ABC transporter substrate-binding protein [Pseudomonas sp. BBP2017]
MTAPSIIPTAEQEQAALHWLRQINEQPALSEGATFKRWLLANPAHPHAYAKAQALWRLTEGPARTLAGQESDALQRYLQSMDQPQPSRHWRRGGVFAAVACLVLALGTLAGWHPAYWVQDLQADYVTAAGQVRLVTLADQSRMTLDAGSAVSVQFSQGQRQVRVHRGAAFFQVTHTGEPFVVVAGDGAVHVLGTQFEVRRQDAGAQVTVLSGRVAVSAAPGQAQQQLAGGQHLAYRDTQLGNVEAVDSEARLAWRQGWLNYYQVPLSVVIDDLARYYPGRILLLDSELAKRTVSGSFPAAQPLAALDSLGAVLGFKRHTLLGRVTVVR